MIADRGPKLGEPWIIEARSAEAPYVVRMVGMLHATESGDCVWKVLGGPDTAIVRAIPIREVELKP